MFNMLYARGIFIFSLLNFIGSTLAIIPSIPIDSQRPESIPKEEPSHLSLPNLLQTNDIQDLELIWSFLGNPELDTGRLIFGKGVGSVWSIPQLENSRDEWTIELVFRSSGTTEKDLRFSETNGLSLWLIDPSTSSPIDSNNMENFGGPSTFDGFQLLINSKDTKGLKIFNNDGSKVIGNNIERSIGNCAFNYLDSQVPFTLRISYSKSKSWFKVQIDNNVCFKTDQIIVPEDVSDFKLGFSSAISPESSETFEVLELKVYSHLTEDAIDNHGVMTDGHIQVQYTTVVDESQATEAPYFNPRQVRESLMERTSRHREEMERQLKLNKEVEGLDNQLGQYISESNIKILKLEQLIEDGFKLSEYNSKTATSQIKDVESVQIQQKEILNGINKSLQEFKSTISQQYAQMLGAVSKLNEKMIGEVREQQFTMDELSKKVDLLMSNHKEIQYQATNPGDETDLSGVINAIIKWILIPVALGIFILTFVVSRLRHDIKHAKLL